MSCGKNIDHSYRYETTSSATCGFCGALLGSQTRWIRDDKPMCAACYFQKTTIADPFRGTAKVIEPIDGIISPTEPCIAEQREARRQREFSSWLLGFVERSHPKQLVLRVAVLWGLWDGSGLFEDYCRNEWERRQ